MVPYGGQLASRARQERWTYGTSSLLITRSHQTPSRCFSSRLRPWKPSRAYSSLRTCATSAPKLTSKTWLSVSLAYGVSAPVNPSTWLHTELRMRIPLSATDNMRG